MHTEWLHKTKHQLFDHHIFHPKQKKTSIDRIDQWMLFTLITSGQAGKKNAEKWFIYVMNVQRKNKIFDLP